MDEIIIDGTNGAGKTTLIEYLNKNIDNSIYYQPFRIDNVFESWKKNPLDAATRIHNVTEKCRKEALSKGIKLLIWDRAWPTVFVSTNNIDSRNIMNKNIFTLLLLSNSKATVKSLDRYEEKNKTKVIPKQAANIKEINYWINAYYNLSNEVKNMENVVVLDATNYINLEETLNLVKERLGY